AVCPSNSIQINGHCYYLNYKTGSWNEARKECRYRGGDLAVPNSSEINDQIFQLIKVLGDRTAWIGVHRDENKKFITTSGVSVSYKNWDTGEPNNYRGKEEDCVEMYAISDKAGKWNDELCSYNRRYVCELAV
ncbi:Hypothetical predicted protein, partial [Paramuricea clavata]